MPETGGGSTGTSLLGRRLLAGGAWALGGRMLLALAGLALNALLARLLAPGDLGLFFLMFSIVSFFAVLGSLGMNAAIVRFLAENLGLGRSDDARAAARTILLLGTLASGVVGVVYFFFGGPLLATVFDAPALGVVAGLTVGWILVLTLQNLLAEAFRGLHDIRLAAVFGRSAAGFGSLASSVMLVLCLAAIWALDGRVGLRTVVIAAVVTGVAAVALAGWFFRGKLRALPSDGGSRGGPGFAGVLRLAWPLLIADLTLLVLTQADLWILGAFRPQDEVALYGAAVRLVTFVLVPLLVVNAVLPPVIVEKYAQGKTHELQQALRVTATLAGIPALSVLLGFVFFGEQILVVVFGDYYAGGTAILVALSLGQLVSVLTGSCGITLAMTGHQTLMMVTTVATGCLTVTAGLLAVGPFGATGVAVASAAGLALQNVLLWLGARLATGMRTNVGVRGLRKDLRSLFAG